jgi:Protein of unknown function (DUF3040)
LLIGEWHDETGEREMSLPASEERALTRIEQTLVARDPRLKSIFAIFTRLTVQEAMPAIEQLRRRPWWRPQPGAVVVLAVAVLVGMIVIGSLGSARACIPARSSASAGAQPSAIAATAMVPGCAPNSKRP